jgi:hypothetical protein
MKRRLSKKEELLRLFIRGSQENDCYTVPDLCRKVGLPYELVQRWARDDYRWADVLEACHTRCFDNVEMAMMLGRMKFKEGLKYLGNTELPF